MLKIEWKDSESMERPAEVDETSSAYVVYMRKDIAEVAVPATDNAPATVKYVYKEAVLTKADYALYALAKQVAAEMLAAAQGA